MAARDGPASGSAHPRLLRRRRSRKTAGSTSTRPTSVQKFANAFTLMAGTSNVKGSERQPLLILDFQGSLRQSGATSREEVDRVNCPHCGTAVICAACGSAVEEGSPGGPSPGGASPGAAPD